MSYILHSPHYLTLPVCVCGQPCDGNSDRTAALKHPHWLCQPYERPSARETPHWNEGRTTVVLESTVKENKPVAATEPPATTTTMTAVKEERKRRSELKRRAKQLKREALGRPDMEFCANCRMNKRVCAAISWIRFSYVLCLNKLMWLWWCAVRWEYDSGICNYGHWRWSLPTGVSCTVEEAKNTHLYSGHRSQRVGSR